MTLARPRVVPVRRAKAFFVKKSCSACQGYLTYRREKTRPPECVRHTIFPSSRTGIRDKPERAVTTFVARG